MAGFKPFEKSKSDKKEVGKEGSKKEEKFDFSQMKKKAKKK